MFVRVFERLKLFTNKHYHKKAIVNIMVLQVYRNQCTHIVDHVTTAFEIIFITGIFYLYKF